MVSYSSQHLSVRLGLVDLRSDNDETCSITSDTSNTDTDRIRLHDSAHTARFHTAKVFDFDQTLFQSPLPNPALWDPSFIGMLTSWAYCGTGWWHNPGTLEMGPDIEASLWDGWWNEAIVEKVRESSGDPGCLTILLTGRNGPTFGQKLVSMIQSKGLEFDMVVTKPTTVALLEPSSYASKKADRKAPADNTSKLVEKYLKVHTFNTKHDFLYNVLYEYPAIRTMHLWDDRPCQIAKFRQAGQEWLDKKMLDYFEITVVQESMVYLDPQREINLVLAMVEANNRQVDIEEQGGPFLVPGIGAVPRTRPELRDRKIWDPYETYVPQRRHRIEVTRIVRYTGVMFSEAVQRIMRDKLGGSHPQDGHNHTLLFQHHINNNNNNNTLHDTTTTPWVDRPLVLRGQDLSKWVIPDDLHVTLCLGTGTPEYLESVGGLGATVLVEVESVGELENRIWALKVKEMNLGVLSGGGDCEQVAQDDDTREVRIVAPNGELYSSLEALRAAYISRPSTAASLSSSPVSSPTTRTPSIQDHHEAAQSSSHSDIPLDLVDLDRLGHVVLKKEDTTPHITMAYDRLNGTRAMDSGKITQWEPLTDAQGQPFPYRLVFVGTIAEKMLLGMKARKMAQVSKAEVSLGNLIKSLTGDKTITGKEMGEMIHAVKEEMEKMSVENRLANEERIMTIVHDVCDRHETKKLLSHHNSPCASNGTNTPTIAIQE
ncbi:hypothetical protein BGW39_006746 [Mortierella sp. 14UC]|nr:hypothetical protein BGW39_006746 [Mortierella sp. 14UC]